MIKVAILGFGTVGSGVEEVLRVNADLIKARAGEDIRVKYIVDIRDFSGTPFADLVVKDFALVENDPEVRVVIETIGGSRVAYDFTKRALQAGKSVVTSNKELVAKHGAELLKIAASTGVNYLFEASVGGGIPILRPLMQCLTANQINEITGILNGTTNYILTKMIGENQSFDDALKTAQSLGYAEADPSADVDGIDACRKTAILADLANGCEVDPETIDTTGIRGVSLEDAALADKAGCVIKLLGRVIRYEDGTVTAFVAPHLVPKTEMLSHVDDVFNAIRVSGNAVGDVMFYGRGAGRLPTASAVVADVVDAVKHLAVRRNVSWKPSEAVSDAPAIVSPDAYVCRFFVRGTASAAELGAETVAEGAYITKAMRTDEFKAMIAELRAAGREIHAWYRVL